MFKSLRHLGDYYDAVRLLAARDLTVRYSNSVLGVVWSLLNPLLMMVVFTVVFTVLMPSSIEKYPVYILAGLLPWNYFSGALMGTTLSIVHNGQLISRVNFPREILPLAAVISNLVNFLLALVMFFAVALIAGAPLGWTLVYLPLVILLQTVFCLGLGLFLAALNVRFRDTQSIVEVLTLAWFFATPVVYSIELIRTPFLRQLLQIVNPLAALIGSYRNILYYGHTPDMGILLVTAAEALVLLLWGYWFFCRHSRYFVEAL